MHLYSVKIALEKLGYIVSFPSNLELRIRGFNGKYFKAKNQKALSIQSELRRKGFPVEIKLDIDGYYDFIIAKNQPEKILWAVKIGEADYMEQIITKDPAKFEAAKIWASNNGFDRFRISEISLDQKPDFIQTIN